MKAKKKFTVLFLSILLLFGCSQMQGENGTQTTADDSQETAASIPQDLEANHTYIDAEILETRQEDGQFYIKFSAWLHDGMIEGEVTASESLYNALIEFQESHSAEDLKFDLSVDGDDSYMLGIASATKRKVKP